MNKWYTDIAIEKPACSSMSCTDSLTISDAMSVSRMRDSAVVRFSMELLPALIWILLPVNPINRQIDSFIQQGQYTFVGVISLREHSLTGLLQQVEC